MIYIYIMLYISILLHELMHYILAKSLRISIMEVKIGAEWPQINIGKWKLSPIIGNSYVEVDYECFLKKIKNFIIGLTNSHQNQIVLFVDDVL